MTAFAASLREIVAGDVVLAAAQSEPGQGFAVLQPGLRRHAVLEANAFGDLLPGALCEGRDAYEDELAAWPGGAA